MIDCDACKGTGLLSQEEACPVCNGLGWINSSNRVNSTKLANKLAEKEREMKTLSSFRNQVKAKFASDLITTMNITMKESEALVEALGEISRAEAVDSIILFFREEMEKLK